MSAIETPPLITIITPTFNAATCIEKCIQSIINQTHSDAEHLIVDGLSTDNTCTIVQGYQAKFPYKVRIVSEQDKGIYDAMNKGVQQARGKWLLFLGSDDFLYDNTVLEKVSSILLNTNKDILYGDAWMEKKNTIYDGAFDTEKLLKHNFCHQAVFYNTSVFERMGLYNLKYKIEADYDFNLRCWLSGSISFQYVPVVIAFHASGGVSTEQRDSFFIKDYPTLAMTYTLKSSYNKKKKIDILAKIYRKMLLRYSISNILKQVFSANNLFYKSTALLWMPFAFIFKRK